MARLGTDSPSLKSQEYHDGKQFEESDKFCTAEGDTIMYRVMQGLCSQPDLSLTLSHLWRRSAGVSIRA